ncbi:MAG: hypothetical protein JNK82_05160 [Myxococcaceae bacterium]|nr:hypothetical protein [Myxococcaceae bacterium]
MHAEPHDVARRRVLFDAWAQRGDVRGELGALVKVGAREAKARAAELIAKHGRSWLHPLGAVIPLSGALFAGPLLDKVIVFARDAADFDAVAEHPRWSTVKSISFAFGSKRRRLTKAMTGVVEAGPLDLADLRASVGLERLEQLEFEGPAKALAELELPALKRLIIRHDDVLATKKVAKVGWFDRLERLEHWVGGHRRTDDTFLTRCWDDLAKRAPRHGELRLGVLLREMRSGWVVCRAPRERTTVRLFKPDNRLEWGRALARSFRADLDDTWAPEDDWLTYGLGVP